MEKFLGLPFTAAKHAVEVDRVIVLVHWLMAALFVGWFIYFAYAIWRFRATRERQASYLGARTHASSYLEVVVALLETVILIGFALPFWARAADKFPRASESTVVRVVAQQFNWNFMYPGPDGEFGRQDMTLVTPQNMWGFDTGDAKTKDNFATLNELRVPVNKPVIAYISSKDVIHSFKIPNLRVAQDAIPGMAIPIHFTPTEPGTYQIYCAQLCGNGHAAMAGGRLIVETQDKYDAWVRAKTGTTAAAYE